jgi:hypothetical protein
MFVLAVGAVDMGLGVFCVRMTRMTLFVTVPMIMPMPV